jgi:sialate O-acetylesterase
LALAPAADLAKGEWILAAPATVGNFTAVGYFYAKELSQKLGVTIGLINTTWGGSQAEGWISKESMQSSPLFKQYAANLPSSWQEADKRRTEELKQYAYFLQ